MRKIVWAGDSTVAFNSINTYPQTGIGQGFARYIKPDIPVINRAVNGRSTKSFMDEGRLLTIEKELETGDWLFIQFSHNDEKKEDPARYTDPDGSFRDNLKTFIRVAKEKGAIPVLISPLARRSFDTEQVVVNDDAPDTVAAEQKDTGRKAALRFTHGTYPEAVKAVAEEEKVVFVDLNQKSRALMEELGPEGTKKLFLHIPPHTYPAFPEGKADNSHLQSYGAVVFAGLVAEALKPVFPELFV